MSVKLLTELHLEFLSLKGGCIGLYESTLVKLPHCAAAHIIGEGGRVDKVPEMYVRSLLFLVR